jgi:hypothetical protein
MASLANTESAEVPEASAGMVAGFLDEALWAFNAGQFADAQALLEALFTIGRPTPTSLWLHAICASEQGQLANAEASFKWAEQLLIEHGTASQPEGYELLRDAAAACVRSLSQSPSRDDETPSRGFSC